MFGISGGELIILLLIGLVVLGPERLPRVANQIGGWLGQARRMTRVMKRQLEEELDLNETLNINPPPAARTPSTQPHNTSGENASPTEDEAPEHTLPRDDDDYSPAHDADEMGTGVGDETGNGTVDDTNNNVAATDAHSEASAEAVTDTATAAVTDSVNDSGGEESVANKPS